jgi:WD40 repeat protein
MPDTHGDFLRLLRDSFDESELRDICFHLGIDYESLPGQDKRGKSRSLLQYCLRTKREQELVTLCRQLSPNHEWPELTKKRKGFDSPTPMSAQDPQRNRLHAKWLGLSVWVWGTMLLAIITFFLITTNLRNLSTFAPTPAATTPIPKPTSILLPSLETITVNNARDLEEVAQYGEWFANGEISYSPDGLSIAVGTVKGVYIHDTQNLTSTQYISTTGDVSAVTFSPSGKYLAFDVDGELNVYHLQKDIPEMLTPEGENIDSVTKLVFMPNDILVIGSYQRVDFWQPETDTFLQPITATNYVTKIALTTDNELLAIGNDDGTIQLWYTRQCLQNPDITCTQVETPLTKEASRITGLSFLPDQRLLAASASDLPVVNLWDFSDCTQDKELCGQPFGTLPLSEEHLTTLTSLSFSSDGQILAAGSSSGYLEFWDVDTEGPEWNSKVEDLHGGSIIELIFSPDSQILVAEESNGAIRFWDLQGSNLLSVIYDHVWIASMAMSQDSTSVVLGSWANVVRLLSLKEGQFAKTWGETDAYVVSVSISHNGRFVAAHTEWPNRGVWISQIESTDSPVYLGKDKGAIFSIAFSPVEEKIVAGTDDGKWYLWNDFSNEVPHLLNSSSSLITATVSSIAFSSDGQTIITGHQDGSIQLWDAKNGELLSEKPQAHAEQVNSIVFSRGNNTWVASGASDGEIKLWTIDNGNLEEVRLLEQHNEAITSLSFSPDNTLLASASIDNTVRLWQVSNGEPLDVYRHEQANIYEVTFSSDGTFIVSAGSDGIVHIWGKKDR